MQTKKKNRREIRCKNWQGKKENVVHRQKKRKESCRVSERVRERETQFIDHFTHCDAVGWWSARCTLHTSLLVVMQRYSRTSRSGDPDDDHCELLTKPRPAEKTDRQRLTTTFVLSCKK